MSDLLPAGIRQLRDAPYPLQRAVKRALMFLSFEELPEEDVPPRNIWLANDELADWFKDVRRRQKERMGGKEIEDERQNSAIDLLVVGDQ